MKESDLSFGLDNLIEQNTQWGIRLKYPSTPNEIIPLGDEFTTDIILQHGVLRTPPKNDLGEYAIGAKKVRISGTTRDEL